MAATWHIPLAATWHIPSNSGHDSVHCELGASRPDGVLVCELQLVTRHPDRRTSDRPAASDVDEHVLRLGQHLVRRDQLVRLAEALDVWLHSNEPFTAMLSADSDQKLVFTIGPDPKLISSKLKPALRVRYDGFAITADWFTILDETCIRIARDELRNALRETAEWGTSPE